MKSTYLCRVLVRGVVLVILCGFGLLAQVDTGTIRGTITDVSSKVVPGAKVTITQEETGLSLNAQAGPDGSYVFTPVRVGTYTVTASYTGSETISRSNIPLHVQQN